VKQVLNVVTAGTQMFELNIAENCPDCEYRYSHELKNAGKMTLTSQKTGPTANTGDVKLIERELPHRERVLC